MLGNEAMELELDTHINAINLVFFIATTTVRERDALSAEYESIGE